jgi:uncharacterized protein
MSSNPITWWEIQVPDLERAKAFYGGVFDWSFKPWQDGYEGVHTADGKMVGGMTHKKGEPAGRDIHVCFTADYHGDGRDDTLEQLLDKVRRHGGTVKTERTEIGADMGWYATVADPSGLSFDLWTGRPAA